MKISELMDELERILWRDGNLDVWATYGCGCCEREDQPELKVRMDDKYYEKGLHLN